MKLKGIRRTDNVHITAGVIQDDQLQLYFNAADVVLIARESLNSGIPFLAESFNKIVVGMESGNITECINDFNGYVYKDRRPKLIADLLSNALNSKKLNWVTGLKEKYSWNTIGQKHVQFYNEISAH